MDDDVYARAEAWLRARRDRQLRGSRAWLVLDGALREYVAIGDGADDSESRARSDPKARGLPHGRSGPVAVPDFFPERF